MQCRSILLCLILVSNKKKLIQMLRIAGYLLSQSKNQFAFSLLILFTKKNKRKKALSISSLVFWRHLPLFMSSVLGTVFIKLFISQDFTGSGVYNINELMFSHNVFYKLVFTFLSIFNVRYYLRTFLYKKSSIKIS